jgi:hypothetical protein
MYKGELELTPYDDRSVELGLCPWGNLSESLIDNKYQTIVRRTVERTLIITHIAATSSFFDPAVVEEDYERPFIFRSLTNEAYNGESPKPRRDNAFLALDALYEFAAAKVFQRGYDESADEKLPNYYRGISKIARNALTQFLNNAVYLAQPKDPFD